SGIWGVIGGTGLSQLEGLQLTGESRPQTPWGEPSAPLIHGELAGQPVCFLARHGHPHTIPPHRVNYRANLWALREAGVSRVVAVNAVGGIHADLPTGRFCVPDQLIDYTWGRPSTFYEDGLDEVVHVDFAEPYDASVRAELLRAAGDQGLVSSAHDLSEGGLAQSLTDGVLRFGVGARVWLTEIIERDGVDAASALFSESTGRVLVTVPREEDVKFRGLCEGRGYPVLRIGVTDAPADGSASALEVQGLFPLPVPELRALSTGTLPAAFGAIVTEPEVVR
uniref:phosphorylase family protein n=1 Tax=uncultured Microbacterium sp. TaxID=191216 RepID=UPI002584FDA3